MEKDEIEQVENKDDANKRVDEILKKAKEKGKVTYGELASELGEADAEQIDKVLFSDIDVRKKRIAIRKLKRKGLDSKYIKIFINLLEYIQKI